MGKCKGGYTKFSVPAIRRDLLYQANLDLDPICESFLDLTSREITQDNTTLASCCHSIAPSLPLY